MYWRLSLEYLEIELIEFAIFNQVWLEKYSFEALPPFHFNLNVPVGYVDDV